MINAPCSANLNSIYSIISLISNQRISFSTLRLAITHTFADGEQIRLINEGNTPLKFALCAKANDPITEPFREISAQEEEVIPVTELGNIDYCFLKVENLAATEKGRYTIMLL